MHIRLLSGEESVRSRHAIRFAWLVGMVIAGVTEARAELVPVVQVTGRISVSADAQGNNNPSGGTLRVNKPAGATVRGAFLMAASYSNRTIADGDVSLNREEVTWNKAVHSNAGSIANFFHNVFADVTGMLKPALDEAASGILGVTVTERNTQTIDGTILIVIFDDPAQMTDSSILLLFGGQNTLGDTFSITLSRPLGTSTAAVATMGLGISFGFQGSTGSGMFSRVDVNGARLTSSAGGEDDGAGMNGALITVGGIGDSTANPGPFAPITSFRSDDELYNIRSFVPAGARSVSVRTFNPSNDDNILFVYFKTSEPAAIVPPVSAPGIRTLVGTIDPSLPTIVLTHGLQKDGTDTDTLWTGSSSRQAADLIASALGTQRANVVQYIWEEAFQPFGCGFSLPNDDAYKAAQQNVVDAGLRLGSELLRALGSGYNKRLHFIGHSLGSAVNSYAATALADQLPQLTSMQFTALDRPHHVTKICGMTNSEERIYGFNADFFAMNLPFSRRGLSLKVDNYYSLDGFGVGDVANGAIYNHPALTDSNRLDDRLFENEGFDNSHTGVQQWYRWTMAPNDPFPGGSSVCDGARFAHPPSGIGGDLNPCRKGWHWSVLDTPSAFPTTNGARVSRTTAVLLRLTDPRDFGCSVDSSTTSTAVTCNEASSPFSIASVDIPEDAKFISFDYNFNNSGDGDFAVVFLDGIPIWKLGGESALSNQTLNSGAIPVDGFTGRHDLMVALFGVGQPNFGFSLTDFRVFGVGTNNPPVAFAGANQLLECTASAGTPVVLDGSASFDVDGDALSYVWRDASGNVIGNEGVVRLAAALGSQTFTLSISDGKGASAHASVVVSVQDTTAPALSLGLSPDVLWPPNHQLRTVSANIQVADACEAAPAIRLVSLTSSEADDDGGDGRTKADIQGAELGTDDRSFLLRAERSGKGAGRVYTATYMATDGSGNAARAQASVSVPHSQKK